jgi:predicted secreted protein
MSIALGIALYFMIWWIVLFAVLPFGVRTQEEDGEVVPGTPPSAPASVRMVRIFLINTVVATVVFALVWASIEFNLLGLLIPDDAQPPAAAR